MLAAFVDGSGIGCLGALAGMVVVFIFGGGGGVFDAGGLVGINGGKGAEKHAADESEDGGAARRDLIVGQKLVEVPEGMVDALSGLKALITLEQRSFEFGEVGFLELHGMGVAKGLAVGFDRKFTAAPGRGAALAAIGIAGGRRCKQLRLVGSFCGHVSFSSFSSFSAFLFKGESRRAPPPGVFS